MKRFRLATAGFVVAMAVAPVSAWAAFCPDGGPMAPAMSQNGYWDDGTVIDTEAQEALDLQRLRASGVAAVSAERWNGCLRVFVEQADGSTAAETYDPASLRRLQ